MELKRRYKLHDGSEVRVLEVERHRNGVGGDGFYAVRFVAELDTDGGAEEVEFIGIVNDSESLVYVVDPQDLTRTMRGHDWFGDAVVSAVNAYTRAYGKKYGWPTSKDDLVTKGSI